MDKSIIKKKVLVTGANGFLGKELVKQLLNLSFPVVALTSNKNNYEYNSRSNLTVIETDNLKNETSSLEDIDVLVNCAFPRSSDPELLAKGIEFTENLIKTSIGLNIKEIINISSQSVYSQKVKSSTDEKSQVIPETFYGMTKYATERIVALLCENSNNKIYYSNIRLASLTGIGLEQRMTNRFVKFAINGETIHIHGGNQKVSYLDVRDAAAALIKMINTNARNWKSIYNLGNEQYSTVLEIAQNVKEKAKNYQLNSINIDIQKGNDNFNNLINSTLFYEDFNWKPYYTIPLMIDDLFNHYMNDK